MTEKPAATAPELEGKTVATTPEPVEVTIGAKTVKVEPSVAEAIKEFQKSVADAGVATKDQLDRLTAQVAELTPKTPAKPASADTDLENLIFTNPKKAVQLIKDEIRGELNAQLDSTKAQNEFWTEFYRQNDDLKDADWLVKSILQREMGKMSKMMVPDAMKYLAETVKGDILKLSGKKTKKEPGDQIEGANESTRKQPKEAETGGETAPTSITDVLKARKAARRSGARAAA